MFSKIVVSPHALRRQLKQNVISKNLLYTKNYLIAENNIDSHVPVQH